MSRKIEGRAIDLGGFQVTRILPNETKKMVGPFIFVDHMGPAAFSAGEGIDVRPHPHIGIATVTYMLEGSMLHRDSLGNCLEISPGELNWIGPLSTPDAPDDLPCLNLGVRRILKKKNTSNICRLDDAQAIHNPQRSCPI